MGPKKKEMFYHNVQGKNNEKIKRISDAGPLSLSEGHEWAHKGVLTGPMAPSLRVALNQTFAMFADCFSSNCQSSMHI